ncbi:MAG: glycoside hydrolase family 1 protein [Spirochaetales bacterium]|nr:glycoside hydrolase family 1 protein [Spirochaetales bacterium]
MKPYEIPENLLLGTATAATQIEGGDVNSNWYHWGEAGRIAGDGSPIVAADHWNRYDEDIRIMAEHHHQIYRMSIEWSRIEPREGEWSADGIAHYRDEFETLIRSGIEPLVTLHHFSHPQWLEEKGGWTSRESVDLFLRFTEKVVEAYGDIISEYCTINEPNVFAHDTYIQNKYPGGKTDDTMSYFRAARNMIRAHLGAYKLIHTHRANAGHTDTKVGYAIHMAWFEAHRKNPLSRISRAIMDYAFHGMFNKSMMTGKLPLILGGGRVKNLHSRGYFSDYIGINYYSRHIIKWSWNPAVLFGSVNVEENLTGEQQNDLGWELYPPGLYKVSRKLFYQYKLPVFITENGIPDAEDRKRGKYIIEHLAELKKLIDNGIDVQRYYHWSLLDNMEWDDGYGPRFGLIGINYENQERIIRRSAELYAAICRNREVSQDMIEEFCKAAVSPS